MLKMVRVNRLKVILLLRKGYGKRIIWFLNLRLKENLFLLIIWLKEGKLEKMDKIGLIWIGKEKWKSLEKKRLKRLKFFQLLRVLRGKLCSRRLRLGILEEVKGKKCRMYSR